MLVVQHNQQEWLAFMKEQLYDDEVQELKGTSIVTEFINLYLANRLPTLKCKLTQWLVTKKLPDQTTGITIKVANAKFPPSGKDWPQDCQGSYAKFTIGQHLICMQNPQNFRQSWPEDFAKPDGPVVQALFVRPDGQAVQAWWENTVKNSMVIAFTIGNDGVCLQKDGVGLAMDQFLSEISDQDMLQRYTLWEDALTKSWGQMSTQGEQVRAWGEAHAAQTQPPAPPAATAAASGPIDILINTDFQHKDLMPLVQAQQNQQQQQQQQQQQ